MQVNKTKKKELKENNASFRMCSRHVLVLGVVGVAFVFCLLLRFDHGMSMVFEDNIFKMLLCVLFFFFHCY